MITKHKFEIYQQIRKEGLLNMFNVRGVVEESDGQLDRDDCLDIMGNYGKYQGDFGE